MRHILVGLLSFITLTSTSAGWFTSDGKDFAECMENRRREIRTDAQAMIAARYCRSKHPEVGAVAPPRDPTVVASFQRFDDAKVHELARLIKLNDMDVSHVGIDFGMGIKSDDFRHYLRIQAFNRNEFPVSGIVVGVPISSNKPGCPTDRSQYVDIYACSGAARAGLSGTFQCDIPGIEKKKRISVCLVGFQVTATESQMRSFIQTHGLQN